mgnify:CR=1 FL=1
MKKNTYSVQSWSMDGNEQYSEITVEGLKKALQEYKFMKEEFSDKEGYIEILNISNEDDPESWYCVRYSKL